MSYFFKIAQKWASTYFLYSRLIICQPLLSSYNAGLHVMSRRPYWWSRRKAILSETGNNTCTFCEEILGKMQFWTFRERVGPRILSLESVGLITLEQVNTSVVENFDGEANWLGVVNLCQGHPTTIFGKLSVRKTIWDLEFSDHFL